MAARGSSKRLSVEQEDYIAIMYDGTRSASSGAADTDQGDVRTSTQLIEAKYSSSPPKRFLDEFTKIAMEAISEGREPMLALRYHVPGHPLADHNGYLDLSVRSMWDDIERDEIIRDMEAVREGVIARAEA